jgi:hypothetical protein
VKELFADVPDSDCDPVAFPEQAIERRPLPESLKLYVMVAVVPVFVTVAVVITGADVSQDLNVFTVVVELLLALSVTVTTTS